MPPRFGRVLRRFQGVLLRLSTLAGVVSMSAAELPDTGLFDDADAFQSFAERSPEACLQFIAEHRDSLTEAVHKVHAAVFASVAHRTLGDYAASHEAASRAVGSAREGGDTVLRVMAKHALAVATYLEGGIDEASGIVDAALTLADFHLLEAEKTPLLNLLGIINWRRGNLPRALEVFEESTRINRVHGTPRRLHANLSNTGIMLYRMGEYEKSIDVYEEALQIIEGKDMPLQRAAVLSNLGESYVALGNTRRGEELILESLALEREIGNEKNIALTLFILGKIASEEGEWAKARRYYDEALDLQQGLKTAWDASTTILHIARDLVAQGRYAEALEFMEEGFGHAKAIQSHTLLRDYHAVRADAFAGSDEPGLAKYHKSLAGHFDALAHEPSVDPPPPPALARGPSGLTDGASGQAAAGIDANWLPVLEQPVGFRIRSLKAVFGL
ncbi:MAG: tetratricopeptide repeat protein [Opitutales bacterium]|nr:tetratricopeptide repeat protein [Opitutales bacterium]